MASDSYMRSAEHFAIEMCKQITQKIKELQKSHLSRLNDYCRGFITCDEYCKHLKAYQSALLCYDYWRDRAFHYARERLLKNG